MAKKRTGSPNNADAESRTTASVILGRPLKKYVHGLKPAIIEKLFDVGITDAEQLLAVAVIEDTYGYLVDYLEVSKPEFDKVVEEARKVVPAPIAMGLAAPDTHDYGFGALAPLEEMEGERPPEPKQMPVTAAPLPASVNLIGKMPIIKNQAAGQSCVAFTLSAIHDYATRLSNGQPNNYSEQHLYYETKQIDGQPVCGTWQAKAAIVLANRGQCLEATWPFDPTNTCNNHGPRPANARPEGQNHRIQLVGFSGNGSKDVQWIKSALAANRPVGVSVPVYNSWASSSRVRETGALQLRIGNEPRIGGHAVCLVGYQDTPNAPGGGYFILRNSWGTSWGNQCPYGAGYGGIPYQYIAQENTEAFTLPATASSAPGVEGDGEGEEAPQVVVDLPPVTRTITIRVKAQGNVNLIIE